MLFCNHILSNLIYGFIFSGLVVPDVPLEETEILRKEAIKKNIELVSFRITIQAGFVSAFMAFMGCIIYWVESRCY